LRRNVAPSIPKYKKKCSCIALTHRQRVS
jgi:hypothetical protein